MLSLCVCVCGLGSAGVVDREMKDPSRSSSAPNMTVSNDVILTNQFNLEDNPFAEYMWMENEEEFNRQVTKPPCQHTSVTQDAAAGQHHSYKHICNRLPTFSWCV